MARASAPDPRPHSRSPVGTSSDSSAKTAESGPGPSTRLPAGARLGVVLSTYHHELTGAMLDSARAELARAGLDPDALRVVEVPGAFEIPLVARALGVREEIQAVLCFGLVLKGETTHDQHIATSVSAALQRVSLDIDKPMLFGVLTCNTLEQARARALPGGHDKGREVARAAVEVLAALENARRVDAARPRAGFGFAAQVQP